MNGQKKKFDMYFDPDKLWKNEFYDRISADKYAKEKGIQPKDLTMDEKRQFLYSRKESL